MNNGHGENGRENEENGLGREWQEKMGSGSFPTKNKDYFLGSKAASWTKLAE
jgi:hypothetical protein